VWIYLNCLVIWRFTSSSNLIIPCTFHTLLPQQDEWDCESILSTYSTLDNHPTLIKDKNSKFRKYRSYHQRSLDAEAAKAGSSNGSVMSGSRAAGGFGGGSISGRSAMRGSGGSVSGSVGPGSVYGTPSGLAAQRLGHI
jgi:hypothetical protein